MRFTYAHELSFHWFCEIFSPFLITVQQQQKSFIPIYLQEMKTGETGQNERKASSLSFQTSDGTVGNKSSSTERILIANNALFTLLHALNH